MRCPWKTSSTGTGRFLWHGRSSFSCICPTLFRYSFWLLLASCTSASNSRTHSVSTRNSSNSPKWWTANRRCHLLKSREARLKWQQLRGPIPRKGQPGLIKIRRSYSTAAAAPRTTPMSRSRESTKVKAWLLLMSSFLATIPEDCWSKRSGAAAALLRWMTKKNSHFWASSDDFQIHGLPQWIKDRKIIERNRELGSIYWRHIKWVTIIF